MKQGCFGTPFTFEGKEYYRCLMNGKIEEILITGGGNCPMCNRPIYAHEKVKNPPFRDVRNILIPDLGWVHFKYIKKGGK